jgi:Tol biopolymer transport system component
MRPAGRSPRHAMAAVVLMALCFVPAAVSCGIMKVPGLGVSDAGAEAILSTFRIVYARPDGVYLARGDATDERRLVEAEEMGKGTVPFLAALSPDGKRVFFVALAGLDPRQDRGSGLSLNLLDVAEGRVTLWRRTPLDGLIGQASAGRIEASMVPAAAWSPDGSRIAIGLRRAGAGGADAVAVMDGAGLPLRVVELPERRLLSGSGFSWDGPDALIVALEAGGAASDEDASGGAGMLARLSLVTGGSSPALDDLTRGANPAVSPDGAKVAIVESHAGSLPDIVLLDRAGAEVDRFTSPPGRALHHPFWSPDGRFIYYHSLASTGPLGLVQVGLLRCLDTRGGRVFDLARLG